MIESWGFKHLPVCMAKTQYSFSHSPDHLSSERFCAAGARGQAQCGAGFVVVVGGSMMTMLKSAGDPRCRGHGHR